MTVKRRRYPKLTAVDLFSGAGGATQGLKDAGWRVVGAVECDSAAASTYRLNHPEVHLFEGDIRRAPIEELFDLSRGELGLLKACPPCQGYSTLGKRDPEDERNDLVSVVWKFIRTLHPRAFVLENVPGLQADERLHRLVRYAKRKGYGVRPYLVEASTYGVPQRRKRLIIVGVRDADDVLPTDLAQRLPRGFDRTTRTVRDVFEISKTINTSKDILNAPVHVAGSTLQRIKKIPKNGGSRFDLPEELQLECHQRLENRSASASYGRMHWDEPAPTMTTRCTTPACGRFIHPSEDRPITLREAALIQTFPKTYRFTGGRGAIERQVGNAVPVRLAEAVGLVVRSLLR